MSYDKEKQKVISIIREIGRFYLSECRGNKGKCFDELVKARIKRVELHKETVVIWTSRPGIMIGLKGDRIKNLEAFLNRKVSIKETEEDILDYLTHYELDDVDIDWEEVPGSPTGNVFNPKRNPNYNPSIKFLKPKPGDISEIGILPPTRSTSLRVRYQMGSNPPATLTDAQLHEIRELMLMYSKLGVQLDPLRLRHAYRTGGRLIIVDDNAP